MDTQKIIEEFDTKFGQASDGADGMMFDDIKAFILKHATAVYEQGKKDGRMSVIEAVREKMPKGGDNPFKHEYTHGWNGCVGQMRKVLESLTSVLEQEKE